MDDVKGRGDTFNDGARYFGVVELERSKCDCYNGNGYKITLCVAFLQFAVSLKFMCLVKVVDLKSLLKSKCAAVFMAVLYG